MNTRKLISQVHKLTTEVPVLSDDGVDFYDELSKSKISIGGKRVLIENLNPIDIELESDRLASILDQENRREEILKFLIPLVNVLVEFPAILRHGLECDRVLKDNVEEIVAASRNRFQKKHGLPDNTEWVEGEDDCDSYKP